jgi:hypothetical protein
MRIFTHTLSLSLTTATLLKPTGSYTTCILQAFTYTEGISLGQRSTKMRDLQDRKLSGGRPPQEQAESRKPDESLASLANPVSDGRRSPIVWGEFGKVRRADSSRKGQTQGGKLHRQDVKTDGSDVLVIGRDRYLTLLAPSSFNKTRQQQIFDARSTGYRLATQEENAEERNRLAALAESKKLSDSNDSAWNVYRTRYVRDQAGGFKSDGSRVGENDPCDRLSRGSAALYVKRVNG